MLIISAIDHRTLKKGLPVRSAVLKQCAVRLVVGWVTTSESPMLIVFAIFWLLHLRNVDPNDVYWQNILFAVGST